MENNIKKTRIAIEAPAIKSVSLQKITDAVFRCQLLEPQYCTHLYNEIKLACSDPLANPSTARLDAHTLGLDQLVSKIVNAIVPSLPIEEGEQKLIYASSAYITINKAFPPSHKRFLTNRAVFTVEVNLSAKFTGGELLWLNHDTCAVEAKESHSVGKAIIYSGRKLHGASAVLTGERVNLVIELKKFYSFPQFSELFTELKRIFLQYLDVQELCALSQTCHEFKNMIYAADNEWAIPEKGIFNRTDMITTKVPNFPSTPLGKAMQEIITAELEFTQDLRYINEHVFSPLFTAIPEMNKQFGTIRVALQRISEVYEKLLADLRSIAVEGGSQELTLLSICTICSSLMGVLPYHAEYSTQCGKLMDFVELPNPEVKVMEEFDERGPQRSTLNSYFIFPRSFSPRYGKLLFQIKQMLTAENLQNEADVVRLIDQFMAGWEKAMKLLSKPARSCLIM